MDITILVACDEKRGIGKNNAIPWDLVEDLQIFKTRTTGSAVLMGRLTWESLPRKPLRNRLNVVITNNPEGQRQVHPRHSVWGPIFASSLENALKVCEDNKSPKIFVIGGEMIYKKAIESGIVSEVIMTQVPGDHDCDRFFPELKDWKKDKVSVHVGFETVWWLPVKKS